MTAKRLIEGKGTLEETCPVVRGRTKKISPPPEQTASLKRKGRRCKNKQDARHEKKERRGGVQAGERLAQHQSKVKNDGRGQ